MSPGGVTWLRVTILALYAFTGGGVAVGGMTAGELVLMVVLGVIAFAGIVLADWINADARGGTASEHR
jgi:Na+/H+ antiporter NhaA